MKNFKERLISEPDSRYRVLIARSKIGSLNQEDERIQAILKSNPNLKLEDTIIQISIGELRQDDSEMLSRYTPRYRKHVIFTENTLSENLTREQLRVTNQFKNRFKTGSLHSNIILDKKEKNVSINYEILNSWEIADQNPGSISKHSFPGYYFVEITKSRVKGIEVDTARIHLETKDQEIQAEIPVHMIVIEGPPQGFSLKRELTRMFPRALTAFTKSEEDQKFEQDHIDAEKTQESLKPSPPSPEPEDPNLEHSRLQKERESLEERSEKQKLVQQELIEFAKRKEPVDLDQYVEIKFSKDSNDLKIYKKQSVLDYLLKPNEEQKISKRERENTYEIRPPSFSSKKEEIEEIEHIFDIATINTENIGKKNYYLKDYLEITGSINTTGSIRTMTQTKYGFRAENFPELETHATAKPETQRAPKPPGMER